MGLNNENGTRLIFDIETAPLAEAGEYIEPAEAPGNYKDPAKIAEFIAKANAENLDRCGLDVDLCRVVAIGWWRECDESSRAVHEGTATDEAAMIGAFWNHAEDAHLVGFNCLGFDLPVLLRRSLYLGVPTPNIQVEKFKHPQVTDLLQVLTFNGLLKMRGLSFYAKRFGFDVADTLTGADIAKAVAEGRWSDVESHVKADIQKTALLAAKLGYFVPAAVGAF